MTKAGPSFWVDPQLKHKAGSVTLRYELAGGTLTEASTHKAVCLKDSDWLRPTLEVHGLSLPESPLRGRLSLTWPNAEGAGESGPRGEIKIELEGEAVVECVRCLAPCSVPLKLSETYSLLDTDSQEADYVLGSRGVALDALLLDAIECALPDYPQCSEGCQGSDGVQ